ncbi:cobalamin B12-binding domain-containing protein [Methylobacterium sp. P1-11]|uniref:cobalamin B12-binding domain-containing protein n=1 Tax=Methylobacterium sp. P1-11 TaxID=2024616 RepID=UPI0011EC52F0|nr:cobalamin B12-binding domain-containing protein [Methylobacterium sp. P1-11]KAA0107633.1 cobalamin B12-binding domain-containing protein [Methylobacterium sp. P1-11]
MLDQGSPHREWAGLITEGIAEAAYVREDYGRRRSVDEARQRTLALGHIVQTDIIPRLILVDRGDKQVRSDVLPKLDTETVAGFTDLILRHDVAAVMDAFTALTSKGYCVDDLFLDLLAPTAALLGRMWDDDLCDFIEVTVGLAQLQFLLATFGSDGGIAPYDSERRILLMGAPGELHTFGLAIVEQFMRKAGWHVASGLASSPEQISNLVGSELFGVVGLTLSRESHLDQLASSIQAVRQASLNPSIGVMVGGPVFLEHPEYVERVGADASAVDAPTAVLLAQRLLPTARSERSIRP